MAIGTGIARGYSNSRGIDIAPEMLDATLKFGPLLIQTSAGAYIGLIEGISEHESYSKHAIKGGVLGLGLGALEMGVGYCVGYTLGGLSK